MGKGVLPEAGPWIDAVERIGLGGTVVIILALGLAVSVIFKGPAYLAAVNEITKTILKYRIDRAKIPAKIKGKQENLRAALSARKRNGNGEKK